VLQWLREQARRKGKVHAARKNHKARRAVQENRLKSRIDYIDTQIDKLVYKLYGLTGEEIKIVEGKDK